MSVDDQQQAVLDGAPMMRASVLHGVGDLTVEDRPVPVPGPREVRVRISSVGVCGSDVHYYEHGRIGSFEVTEPLVLGHEASGVVEAIGPGVTRLSPGDRVSLEPGVPDLTCPQCLAGRYNLCEDMRFHATPPYDGSFAEYVVHHELFTHPVPDSLEDDQGALLEPLSVALWACQKGHVTAGSRVLVTGAGPVGLLVVQVARALGATTVVASDVNASRLALAASLGATATFDPTSDQPPSARVAPTVMIDCSGNPHAIRAAIELVAPAGRVVLVGMGGALYPMPMSTVQERELVVTGTFRYAHTWPTAISMVASGAVQLAPLVTSHHGIEQVAEALTVGRRDPDSIKPVVHPGVARL
jgi:L-iditol 2-dehydrogenase